MNVSFKITLNWMNETLRLSTTCGTLTRKTRIKQENYFGSGSLMSTCISGNRRIWRAFSVEMIDNNCLSAVNSAAALWRFQEKQFWYLLPTDTGSWVWVMSGSSLSENLQRKLQRCLFPLSLTNRNSLSLPNYVWKIYQKCTFIKETLIIG